MKKLLFTIALATILLTSCSKDDSLEQTELQTMDSVYVLNQFNDSATWETQVLDNSQNAANFAYEDPNISYRTNTTGFYNPSSRNGMTLQWDGTSTIQGFQGRAVFKQTTPNFSLHFNMETECITVDGNMAVYGGIVTQVIELSGDAPIIGVGWHFYFKVIDSNSDESVNHDQIANKTIFASPSSPSLCNAYLPNHIIWSSQGYTDVIEPGFVIVEQLN